MKISFAITTHDEGDYVDRLLKQLSSVVRDEDEIVILHDRKGDHEETLSIIDSWANELDCIKIHTVEFEGEFDKHKNLLNSYCTGDWIFQIDADELLGEYLENNIHEILENNDDAPELIWIPRVNVVNGITDQDLINYGWSMTDSGWIAWPDYQGRLYKNSPDIFWQGKVHEKIVGHQYMAILPAQPEFALYHEKDIKKQREQNKLYDQISKDSS